MCGASFIILNFRPYFCYVPFLNYMKTRQQLFAFHKLDPGSLFTSHIFSSRLLVNTGFSSLPGFFISKDTEASGFDGIKI